MMLMHFGIKQNGFFHQLTNSGKSEFRKTHSFTDHWDYYIKTIKIDGAYYDILANIRADKSSPKNIQYCTF